MLLLGLTMLLLSFTPVPGHETTKLLCFISHDLIVINIRLHLSGFRVTTLAGHIGKPNCDIFITIMRFSCG